MPIVFPVAEKQAAEIIGVETLPNGELSAWTIRFADRTTRRIVSPVLEPGRGVVVGRVDGKLTMRPGPVGLPKEAELVEPADLVRTAISVER